ncbi:MAG: hypothetical protein OEX22_13360, partial [Cyclobacteriaceae bacterium]|nr:hypothetical protein [Cyclobacteriaceae bacterium]
SKKKILIISFSDLKYDGRVSRQINFLKDTYHVEVLALSNNDDQGFVFHALEKTKLTIMRKLILALLLLLRQYKTAYWVQYAYKSVMKKFKSQSFDLVIGNDVESLPLAFGINESNVFFDAHEYAPRHFEERLWWRVFFRGFNVYLCRLYIPLVKGMTTVCDGLALEYQKDFNYLPDVITNAPPFADFKINENTSFPVKIIHHGIANASRKMENMLKIMDQLGDKYELDLMLMIPEFASGKSKKYIEEFKSEVNKRSNVKMIAPVRSDEIVDKIKKYDIGLFLLEPINFNYTNALPNKLFEFIQARLAVAIGPSPEMAKVVSAYHCGIISESFQPSDLANQIRLLTHEELSTYKSNAEKAAKELNAEKNKEKLLQLIEEVI